MSEPQPTAQYWIESLGLAEHPEGGFFRETYRSSEIIDDACLPARYGGGRSFSTAIYFLLKGEQFSALHRLASDELWCYHAGGSTMVTMVFPDGVLTSQRIGSHIEEGDSLQVLIPRGTWFGAQVIDSDGYILVGCTVSPGFDFADFELADRAMLVQQFPQHRSIIERLTH